MITWMWLPTPCSYLRRTLCRSAIWPQAPPTCSGCRPSAVTAALEAPAWRNSLRPRLKVQRTTTATKVSLAFFKKGISLTHAFLSISGRLTQNNTAVIFGAAVGGAAMLFIVVVVLFLRRRSVNVLLSYTPCLSVLLISQHIPSFTGFLSNSSALPLWGHQMAFAFTLSSPFPFFLPLANFLFLFIWICVPALTREEFVFNAPCHCSIVIF